VRVGEQADRDDGSADPHAPLPEALGDRDQEQDQGEQHGQPNVFHGRLAGV